MKAGPTTGVRTLPKVSSDQCTRPLNRSARIQPSSAARGTYPASSFSREKASRTKNRTTAPVSTARIFQRRDLGRHREILREGALRLAVPVARVGQVAFH